MLSQCDMVYIDKERQHRRLSWLRCVGCMRDDRLPARLPLLKQIFFGPRPVGQPRLMWHDFARNGWIAGFESGVQSAKVGLSRGSGSLLHTHVNIAMAGLL